MDLIKRARELRHNQTDVERLLWSRLRNRQLNGNKFRRQFPVGDYIVDFVCLSGQVIVELDGGQHVEQIGYDNRRTALLESRGFNVVRFLNNEVIDNLQGVLETIARALEAPSP